MVAHSRGAWVLGTDPAHTRTLAAAGFDWLTLDLQHGRLDDAAMIAALSSTASSVPRWVRVRSLDAGLIGRALDAGADGVIVPMVESAAQARAAVAASAYPPAGSRSWGPFGAGYSSPSAAPPTLCAVMIETSSALDDVDAIAAVEGVGMLFVGPFDLALALGLDLDAMLADDSTESPLRRVAEAARSAGLRAGAFAGTPERAARLFDLGYDDVAVTTDAALIGLGAAIALKDRP